MIQRGEQQIDVMLAPVRLRASSLDLLHIFLVCVAPSQVRGLRHDIDIAGLQIRCEEASAQRDASSLGSAQHAAVAWGGHGD